MNNPKITYILDKFGISGDFESVILQFEGERSKIFCYPTEGKYLEKDISIDEISFIIKEITGISLRRGTDYKTIWEDQNHREITYLRAIFPECLLQIDFSDAATTITFTKEMESKLRQNFFLTL